MPYIDVIHEDDADGDLWKVYDHVQTTRGRVSNVMRVQSHDPKGMRTHLDMYMALVFGKGPLSRLQRELIATVVSVANGCNYCATHHGEAMNRYARDDDWTAQVMADWRGATMNAPDAALADYAEGLTKNPANGRKEAVEALRQAGFDDDAILHATEVAAYFNFVNRLVHGLGVELEQDTDRDYVDAPR